MTWIKSHMCSIFCPCIIMSILLYFPHACRKWHIAALKTCLLLNQFSLSYNPHCHPFSLFSSQRNWQASPSQVKKVRLEVRMWALGSNKKLICLLAHYCGLWLPGPSKWKSNVALHYPFGIQLIAQADSDSSKACLCSHNLMCMSVHHACIFQVNACVIL